MKKNIAIFASGNGSNAENIVRHINRPGSAGNVALIITNRQDAQVIQRAISLGIDYAVVDKSKLSDKKFMLSLLDSHAIDIIVLAGFLLMIPPYLISRYKESIVNIHPSLLPKFGGKGMYGRHVHEAVIAAGESQSGITVHLVSEEYDRGKIIFQATCDVLPGDSPVDVETRVRELEALHFPGVIESLL